MLRTLLRKLRACCGDDPLGLCISQKWKPSRTRNSFGTHGNLRKKGVSADSPDFNIEQRKFFMRDKANFSRDFCFQEAAVFFFFFRMISSPDLFSYIFDGKAKCPEKSLRVKIVRQNPSLNFIQQNPPHFLARGLIGPSNRVSSRDQFRGLQNAMLLGGISEPSQGKRTCLDKSTIGLKHTLHFHGVMNAIARFLKLLLSRFFAATGGPLRLPPVRVLQSGRPATGVLRMGIPWNCPGKCSWKVLRRQKHGVLRKVRLPRRAPHKSGCSS